MNGHDDPAVTLGRDPVLDALLDAFDAPTVEPADHGFQRLVVSVVNQSVSTASARVVRERTFDLLCEPVTPDRVLAADSAALADAGLGEAKTEYVRAAAQAWAEGQISREALADADPETVTERITSVRGLGPWTARMYRVFVLGDPDVFPVGDLAVRRAMAALYGYDDDERAVMVDHAERWRPWRTHATKLLWAYHEAEERPTVPVVAPQELADR